MSDINGSSMYYEEILTGARGGDVVTSGMNVVTGVWGRIHFVTDTKLHGISAGVLTNVSELSNPTAGSAPVFVSGSQLVNTVTAIWLHSGIAICYDQ